MRLSRLQLRSTIWPALFCPVLLPACAQTRSHDHSSIQRAIPYSLGPEAEVTRVGHQELTLREQFKTTEMQEHVHDPKQQNPLPMPHQAPADVKKSAISIGELEQLALANNPTLVNAGMQIEGARARAIQARLWPNPTVGYVGDQIGQKGTAGEFQGGFIEQEIITACKRRLSAAKYNQQMQTAEFNAVAQQLKVANGVRVYAIKVLAAGRMVTIREALHQNAIEEYRTTLEEHNIGRKDKAEVLLAHNRRNEAQIAWMREKNNYEAIWRQLAALVGMPDLPVASLTDTLETDRGPIDYESSRAKILSDSPEVLAARSHVAFEELTLKRERVEPIPNIKLRGSAGYNAPDKETVAGVQIGIDLPVWNRNQGNIRLVEADMQRATAEVRRVELSLQKRLADRFRKYLDALVLVQIYQKENLPNAQQAYEIYRDQYNSRRIAWPEVVGSHRNWLMEQLEYTRNLSELRQQEAAIVGLLSVDGLNEPPGLPPPGHLEVNPQPR